MRLSCVKNAIKIANHHNGREHIRELELSSYCIESVGFVAARTGDK